MSCIWSRTWPCTAPGRLLLLYPLPPFFLVPPDFVEGTERVMAEVATRQGRDETQAVSAPTKCVSWVLAPILPGISAYNPTRHLPRRPPFVLVTLPVFVGIKPLHEIRRHQHFCWLCFGGLKHNTHSQKSGSTFAQARAACHLLYLGLDALCGRNRLGCRCTPSGCQYLCSASGWAMFFAAV